MDTIWNDDSYNLHFGYYVLMVLLIFEKQIIDETGAENSSRYNML